MKKVKRYFGLFLLAALTLMVSNPTVSAQDGQRREACRFLTEEQQDQVKEIRAKYQKDLTYFNNKLNELRAEQRTLIQVEKPNMKDLYKNIESKTELQNKLAKTRTEMHIEIRSIMTEEQRLMMGSRMGKRSMMHRGRHKKMGGNNFCGKGRGNHHMHKGNRGCDCQGYGHRSNERKHRNGDCNNNRRGEHRGMYRRGDCGSNQGKGNFNRSCTDGRCLVNLTEEQQEAFKNLRLEKLKTVNPLKNKLNELRAKKRTLMSSEKINNKEINNLIDSMSDIHEKIAKENIRQRVEMRKLLTKEQRLNFDKRMHQRRHHRKF